MKNKKFLVPLILAVTLIGVSVMAKAGVLQFPVYGVKESTWDSKGRPIWTCNGNPVVCVPSTTTKNTLPPPQAVAGHQYQQYDLINYPQCTIDTGSGPVVEDDQPGDCWLSDNYDYAQKYEDLDGSGTIIYGGEFLDRLEHP